MPATTEKFATTFANGGYAGTLGWTYPGLPGDVAYVGPLISSGDDDSNALIATGFGFTPADVPSGATITGMQFRFNILQYPDTELRLRVKDVFWTQDGVGSPEGVDQSASELLPDGVYSLLVYGADGNTWGGITPTQTHVVSSGWGTMFACISTSAAGNAWAYMKSVGCIVYYETPASTDYTFRDWSAEQPPPRRQSVIAVV